ncbi:hypothetical protein ACIA5H_30085 [Nocardia sp. NPDC051900]|uniref:hypothetical protein n=1 Tax=Nocardia sp. NPDC051900 TaxID=3364326 RepID=UPI0037ABD5C0
MRHTESGEDFADDIIAAFTEYLELSGASYRSKQTRLPKDEIYSRRRHYGVTRKLLLAHLEEYRRRGLALPGKRSTDGRLVANTYFLSAQAGITINSKSLASVFAEYGAMPIDDDTYLFTPVTATLDDRRWQNRSISYTQAPVLARHLTAACFVVIAYLSGQRPGETLNLERGCIDHDSATGLIVLRGKHFKGLRNTDGTPAAEGMKRVDPWVVVQPVATAVEVMGRLHDSPLLFPTRWRSTVTPRHTGSKPGPSTPHATTS